MKFIVWRGFVNLAEGLNAESTGLANLEARRETARIHPASLVHNANNLKGDWRSGSARSNESK
jgi:hypothetical protein